MTRALLIVYEPGLILAWCVWELWSMRRTRSAKPPLDAQP